ncbi:MAG: ABC transporter permease [Lachnospiraceae bacterium]|nr:ABC transporter permease [Lachnospiraceae bacterium]
MKNKNNANNIYRMDGIGKVFRFTLKETFKNKGYLFSFILMVAMMTLMGPISMLSARASEKAIESGDSMKEDTSATCIYFCNETEITLSEEDLAFKGTSFENIKVQFCDSKSEVPSLGDTEIAVYITLEKDDKSAPVYYVKGVISDESKISSFNIDALCEHIYGKFEKARIHTYLSDESYSLYAQGIRTGKAYSETDYNDKQNEKVPSSELITYSTVYSIIIMILVSLTVSYVISSVMEEKTSKLVENLLVSVRPLALIMGKVLAMMVYVLSMLILGGIGASISTSVIAMFNTSAVVEEVGQNMDFSVLFGFELWNILILLLSIALTYLMFSILSGLLGSACAKAEEIGPTVAIINLLSMAGYMSAIFIPMIDNKVITIVFSLLPVTAQYVGPIAFVCDRIPGYIYLISLAGQILFIIWLFRLTAKVYRKLIVNDSKKYKLSEILKLSREGE